MRTNVHVAIISVLAVCILLTNVPFAFADSSSSSVIESQENGVSGDYVSIDLYLKSGDTYTAATSNVFSEGSIGCTATTSGGVTTYAFSASTLTLSKAELYVMVSSTDADAVYSVSSTVAEGGTFNVTGNTYTVLYGDESSLTAVPGTYYPLSLLMDVSAYSSTVKPVMPEISVYLLAVDTVTSTVLDSTNKIDASVVAHYDTADEAAQDMIENNGAGEDGSFTGDDDQTYYIKPGEDTDTTTSIYISDSADGTDISNSSGALKSDTFNASIVIPAGQSFVVAVTIDRGLLTSAEAVVSLKVGETELSTGNINANTTTYVFYRSGNNLSTTTNLNNVTWMQYSGNVTIKLEGSSGTLWGSASVNIQIVFQK